MANIELVIRIPEEDYKRGTVMASAIRNGIPLPKGHGRLIDESKITKCEQLGLVIKDDNVTRCLITDAPTIIEADKE
jgi:hypothetical protein